jgi:hypothetical protein
MYLCRGSPDFFFYFHIWTTEVIPYNALNSEFANLYIYLLLLIHLSRDCRYRYLEVLRCMYLQVDRLPYL